MAEEKMQFKAEIQQLLSMMIHSVYSNNEIFVRELAANAADAIDKARFESLTDSSKVRDWEIRFTADKDAKTLAISDNGIGMSREELIKNIGTIAYSGTKAFLEAMEKAKEKGKAATPELIGQFGVGFYSAFMAADKVRIDTRKAGEDKAWSWTSDGLGEFTIDESDKADIGTTITMYLKDDFTEYLDYWRISSVMMWKQKKIPHSTP